jgi:predicted metal-dependent hydrolase
MQTTTICIDDKEITIIINKSNRAKYISLRIKAGGEIVLTVPPKQSINKAKKFLYSKQGWLLEKISKTGSINIFEHGYLPIMGQEYKIITHPTTSGKVRIIDNELHIYGNIISSGLILEKLLKTTLRDKIIFYADKFTKQIDTKYNKISLRDTKSRWGSCSSKGNLSFCWRIIFAPEEIIKYLVAHEISHLLEMNHSTKFWQIVSSLDNNYKHSEQWLKNNGNILHQYSFSN